VPALAGACAYSGTMREGYRDGIDINHLVKVAGHQESFNGTISAAMG